MKTWKFKGNRIRASDKSLVYHFCDYSAAAKPPVRKNGNHLSG